MGKIVFLVCALILILFSGYYLFKTWLKLKEIEKGRLVITGLKKNKKGRWVIYVKRPSQMSTEAQNNNAD